MIGTKNHILVNREKYEHKGKWKNPNQDIHSNIYYSETERQTLVVDFVNGREQLVPQLTIECYGEHAFCINDYFFLDTGEQYRIEGITNEHFVPNIAIRDMVKPKIIAQTLILR